MLQWCGSFFNPDAFAVPTTGADVFDNPQWRNEIRCLAPGTWAVNLGFKKFFSFSEQTRLEVGVDFNNIFNHPLLTPQDIEFANVGDFDVSLNAAGQPVILPENVHKMRTSAETISVSRKRELTTVARCV
jgi:hypothetical protein